MYSMHVGILKLKIFMSHYLGFKLSLQLLQYKFNTYLLLYI